MTVAILLIIVMLLIVILAVSVVLVARYMCNMVGKFERILNKLEEVRNVR
jgi:flagellar basal body-associated protein FliL